VATVIKMCPKCRSRDLRKYDRYRHGDKVRIRHECTECGHITIYPLIRLIAERKRKKLTI
jgi:Zn ribbon nucleic-acid-binding protein